MNRLLLSAYVIVRNDERFLPACLDLLCSLTEDVVVVDAESEDRTREVVAGFPSVKLFVRPMPATFADQRNFAQGHCRGDWILTLDSDELFQSDFPRILPILLADDRFEAYSFPRLVLSSDSRYVVKDDIDPQIRLYRKQHSWAHDAGGIHEHLRIRGSAAATHPCHTPPYVRYVNYPILHYQLLKSDAELRAKAPAFLERQAVDDKIILDVNWWVRAKYQPVDTQELSERKSSLNMLPGNPEEGLRCLHHLDYRIDELAEYTGLPNSTILNWIERHRKETQLDEDLCQTYGVAGTPSPAGGTVQAQSHRRWIEWLCFLTSRYPAELETISAWVCSNKEFMERQRANESGKILVCGGGLGDIVIALACSGYQNIVYAEIDGPAKRFFEWRRERFGLEGLIDSRTLDRAALEVEHYDIVLMAFDTETTFRNSTALLDYISQKASRTVRLQPSISLDAE